jgi:protein SCO1/2
MSRFSRCISCSIILAAFLSAQEHHHGSGGHYSVSLASYSIPPLTLQDAGGHAADVARLLNGDRPTILQFIFTTCTTVCPVMSATMAAAQMRLGSEADRIRMVSITIDPENDTPAQLQEYARKWGAGPQWIFLTGKPQDVARLQQAFNAYTGSKMNHQPLTFMRASQGPWTRLDGLMSADDFVREYHRVTESR